MPSNNVDTTHDLLQSLDDKVKDQTRKRVKMALRRLYLLEIEEQTITDKRRLQQGH